MTAWFEPMLAGGPSAIRRPSAMQTAQSLIPMTTPSVTHLTVGEVDEPGGAEDQQEPYGGDRDDRPELDALDERLGEPVQPWSTGILRRAAASPA